MIVLVFLLWMMCAILVFTNPNNEETRWGSIIALFGGFGGFGVMLGDGPNRPEWILWTDGISTSLSHYMTPYSILIFGIVFSKIVKRKKHKAFVKLILLFPVIIMYNIDQIYPVFVSNYKLLALWTVPYVFGCNILMIYTAIKENRPAIKKNRIYTCFVIIPTVTFALFTNIVFEAMGIKDVWMLNPWIVTIEFFVFFYLAIKYGFLDVQIKFEKQRRDSTMMAVTSGTTLFNHSIKNEVIKIDMLVNQLKENSKLDESSAENIELVLHSTNHLLELSRRIQSKLDVMELQESEFWLSECIDSALNLLNPTVNSNIKIIKQYEIDVRIKGDSVHFQEAFLNIIKNSIEAMDQKGEIIIKVYKTWRKVFIDVTDTGRGIEKDKLFLVLNPFYSTKGTGSSNYGLGLNYTYKVIQKHNGDIEVKSKVGQGTTMTIILPIKRVTGIVDGHYLNSMGDVKHGKNSYHDC